MARIITIDRAAPELAFGRCREVIRAGGVIAYPTETFYGLGADPRNPLAVGKIFEIKDRQADQPILLLIPGPENVKDWAAEVISEAERLMKRFWPGPLTLLFRAGKDVPEQITAGAGLIGIRVPGSELTRRLLAFLGIALTGTSANVSGGPSPKTAEEVDKTIGKKIDLILNAGRTPGGRPSTVIDVSAAAPRLVREGVIPFSEIMEYLGIWG